MTSEERWADVEGFPGYAVSSHGRVKNLRHNSEIRPRRNSYGHLRVTLRKNNQSYDYYVHHLVARAFLTGYEPSVRVEWVDDNRENNRLENLRFLNGRRLGALRRGVSARAPRRLRIVESGQIFRNVEACAHYIGGDPSNIYRVLRGERFSHKGFTFEYLEDD